jgi:L-2,4-diaminobutyrate decarboxylase
MSVIDSSLATARARIAAAYSVDALEAAGERLVAILGEHFRTVCAGDAKALNWNPPAKLVSEARQFLDRANGGLPPREGPSDIATRVAELVRESLARGQNLHHPHYVGHQVPAPMPLAALFDFVGSVTNQVTAIYEMGPWATAVEHAVVAAAGEQLGFPAGNFAGLVTSGGSLANLTGLLTARNVALGDAWVAGLCGRKPAPVIVVHADAHYSVARSAGILGLGTDNIVRAALDKNRRMDPQQLDETLRGLRSRGVPVIAVSAAACATPIGAFDSLVEIADVCHRHSVWLHVDAAHGGAAAFSPQHHHLVAGLELADSVVCDAHKMMFVPALCAMVFYKNREHRFVAFQQEAPYLFDPAAPDLAQFDAGLVNLECTKRAAAFGLWGIWSLFGPQLFADLVDVTFDLAQQFHAMLVAADDFEPLHVPECNIVAFRYLPREMRGAPDEGVDAFQLRLRRAVVESGEYYLVPNRIDGRSMLRTTMMNPQTTGDDLRGLLDCLRHHGKRLLTS